MKMMQQQEFQIQLWEKELIELPDHSYQSIKVSGGFVCSSGPNNTIEELMKKSDKALYEAKNHYKGHFIEYKGKQLIVNHNHA